MLEPRKHRTAPVRRARNNDRGGERVTRYERAIVGTSHLHYAGLQESRRKDGITDHNDVRIERLMD